MISIPPQNMMSMQKKVFPTNNKESNTSHAEYKQSEALSLKINLIDRVPAHRAHSGIRQPFIHLVDVEEMETRQRFHSVAHFEPLLTNTAALCFAEVALLHPPNREIRQIH